MLITRHIKEAYLLHNQWLCVWIGVSNSMSSYRIDDEETYEREFNRLVLYKTWLVMEITGIEDITVYIGERIRRVHIEDVVFREIDDDDWTYLDSNMTTERIKIQRMKDSYYRSETRRTYAQLRGGFDRGRATKCLPWVFLTPTIPVFVII